MTVIATAGHVDHGKSSLVRALTGTDPDRWAEEKARGLTIDLGFAHVLTPRGITLSFIDVPGHVRFLRNMLAGVGGVGGCLFVVDASEGWKPQSEEHLRILTVLGLEHGVVAVSKSDLLDDELLDVARVEIADRVAGTFLDRVEPVAVSSVTGRGLDRLVDELEIIADRAVAADRGRPRLWIDRVFTARGAGTVVTGTSTGGSLAVDQHLVIAPLGRPVRVRQIQTLGRSADLVEPGHRVALNLVGVDHHEIGRGDVLVADDVWHHTDVVDASLDVLAGLDHRVSRRGAYVAYIGSREVPVRLRVIGPDAIDPGDHGLVRLRLDHRLPLEPGDRYVIRESGRDETIGGGEILDVAPVVPVSRARPDRSVERVVNERGWIDRRELERLIGGPVSEELAAWTVGSWVVAPGVRADARAALETAVDAAGPLGLDVAGLDARQRALVAEIETVVVDGGHARRGDLADPLVDHQVISLLAAAGCAPPDPGDLDIERAELRALVRRGVVVDVDGMIFHPSAIETATDAAAKLIERHPEGFGVAAFRDELGVTRKHAVPLIAYLDARGVTRRRGDLRIAGPRLRPSER